MQAIPLKTETVTLGVVPTHLKFVGGLVPDENGKLPRDPSGDLKVVANLKGLQEASPVRIGGVQIPYFSGVDQQDLKEMVSGFEQLKLETHLILMVAQGDPMNPADEATVVDLLVDGLQAAKEHGIANVSSTSLEAWMGGGKTKSGDDYRAAIDQLVNVHTRAIEKASLDGSPVKAWHIEFLRDGEFQTFTNLAKVREFLTAVNAAVGKPFFKALVDAAHCGDSDLTIDQNAELIGQLADEGALGIFHASAKTTRGCLSTDDGWIGALLAAAARTGVLRHVFVECFHHQDEALAGLRELDSNHGVDTTDGRSYDEVVIDGLVNVARRLNNLVARGQLS